MQIMNRCKHMLRRLLVDQAGSALIEIAVFSTTMVVLIPTMIAYADRIYAQQSLNMGVRAGLQYMMANQSTTNDTLSQIIQNSGTGSTYPISATSSVTCECTGGQPVTCGTTCSGGGAPAKYLTVTASTTMTTLWGQSTQSVVQQTSVRVQ